MKKQTARGIFLISLGWLFGSALGSIIQAQVPMTGAGKGAPTVAGYQGPGDIASGWAFWGGLRGYTAAFSGAVANICDSATGLVCADATWAAGVLTLPLIGGVACNNVTTCNVKILYDQSGANTCDGLPCDLSQATNAARPTLVINCIGALPCMSFNGTAQTIANATNKYSLGQPFTVSIVFNTTGGTTGRDLFSHPAIDVEFVNNNANAMQIYAGGSVVQTAAADDAFHAIQAVFNGASSSNSIDGTTTTGNAGTNEPASDNIFLGSFAGAFFWPGKATEVGAHPGAFNGTQISNMNSNQHSYWGF